MTARARRAKKLVGSPRPRISPPVPANADIKAFADLASKLGLDLFPWQRYASRFIVAKDTEGHPLFREVAIVVARQNGKTSLLLPIVVGALLEGKRVMHAAQHLRLPGEFHRQLAAIFEDQFPGELPSKRGISWRAGQEEIRTKKGGLYQIVAGTGGAPRGPSNDLVVLDEIREFTDDRFIAAIKPTILAKPNAQLIYLSNAGTSGSVVLNSLRSRAGEDLRLAYLEWSAEASRATDDPEGWLEANPSIGHIDGLYENLADEHRAATLGGTMSSFETEHLCRWVIADEDLLVTPEQWAGQEFGPLGQPTRPVMAIKTNVDRERVSAVVAWPEGDRVALDLVADVTGAPPVTEIGPELVRKAHEYRVSVVAFDPWTDGDLIRFFRQSQPVIGQDYAKASAAFAQRAADRQFHVFDEDGVIGSDLAMVTRRHSKVNDSFYGRSGSQATAAEAAIRAAWLASNPVSTAPARIQWA